MKNVSKIIRNAFEASTRTTTDIECLKAAKEIKNEELFDEMLDDMFVESDYQTREEFYQAMFSLLDKS